MLKSAVFIFLVSLALVLATPIVPSEDPDYTDSLKIREGLDVTWEVYEANRTIVFEIVCNCTGWIGFGINENGLIVPADIVMGGVENGVPYFKDRFAVEVGKPYIDASQDAFLLNASEEDGVTTFKYHRMFDTEDDWDIAITDNQVFFIWAVGVSDFINEESLFDTPYHGPTNRGNVTVQILRSPK